MNTYTINIPGYEIVREIARGGMAVVYLARQTNLDRLVALKVMSQKLDELAGFKERFLKEARIVADLGHPNIIAIHDVGEVDGRLYLAMEFAEGGDLKEKIKDGMPVDEVLSIIKDVASALEFAHEKGYVHRDIKPANILFSRSGKVFLTDFGIAKSLQDDATQLTVTGMSLGTPAYMAPEQFEDDAIDYRSDLYSLGVLMVHMLTGEQPYRSKSAPTLMHKHMSAPIPQLESHRHLQPLIDGLMEKDPAARIQTAAQIIKTIDELQGASLDTLLRGYDEPGKDGSISDDQGSPHIFVSYSHANPEVIKEIESLKDRGFNIWYDHGIEAGSEWREEIAQAIKEANLFVFFVSKESVESQNCRKEVGLADKEQVPILAVHLKPIELPSGLDLTLSDRQAILKYKLSEKDYQRKLEMRISTYLDQTIVEPVPAGQKRNLPMITGIMVVCVTLFAGLFFVILRSDDASLIPSSPVKAESSVVSLGPTSVNANRDRSKEKGPPMLAVLPFTSATLTGESEFFAVGVHDDLLTQLAKLRSIRVISRTSVLEYKNTTQNIREIGEALGADAILEGGVQSAGNRIRINAQLIDAHTDEHLWAETYDRQLTTANIFEVQSEIARSITSALQTSLSVQDARELSVIPTENMAAYRAFHHAMKLREDGKGVWNPEYAAALEEAVTLDPAFTRAWAELAGYLSYWLFSGKDDAKNSDRIKRLEQILGTIKALSPESADYLLAQAYYNYYVLKSYDRAYQIVLQAENLVPSDVVLLQLKGWIQRRQGDMAGRDETLRMVQRLDPRNAKYTGTMVENLMVLHRYDEAMLEIQNAPNQGYYLSHAKNLLDLREHKNMDNWANAAQATYEEFKGEAKPDDLWLAYIAAGNYEAATDLLDTIRRPLLNRVVTYWLMKRPDQLNTALIQLGETINEITFPELGQGLASAVKGNSRDAQRFIRLWQRRSSEDMAEQIVYFNRSCWVLGIAAAADAAASCIRKGLEIPSFVMPFRDPYLPFYDSIRNEPVFKKLISDLEKL